MTVSQVNQDPESKAKTTTPTTTTAAAAADAPLRPVPATGFN